MEVSMRKPYFVEEDEDDEMASLAEMEAGVSSPSCYTNMTKMMMNQYHPHSYYNHYSVSSPRSVVVSGKFHDIRFDNSCYRLTLPHFLDSCFLCKKRLGDNRDIFMYRGDTPFCSEECREQEIKRDETKEKKKNMSSSVKAMRRNEKRSSSSSPTRSRDYAFHTGTVAAA